MDIINYDEMEMANHPFYGEYKKYSKLLTSINVCITAAKTCAELHYPEDTLSNHYVSFAVNCQSYFINAVGVREACDLKYLQTPLFSNDDDAVLTVGKVIRNIVAHGHLWTPVYRRECSPGLLVEYYGISKAELKQGVQLAFKKVQEKNPAKYGQKVRWAIEFIDSVKYEQYLDISKFINTHARILFRGIIDNLEVAANEPQLIEISELRKKCELPTLSESLVTIKEHYERLLSVQKSESTNRQ